MSVLKRSATLQMFALLFYHGEYCLRLLGTRYAPTEVLHSLLEQN